MGSGGGGGRARPGGRPAWLALLATVAVVAVACGGARDGGGTGAGGAGGRRGGTLVFGTAADPTSMDGAYVSDGESLRVVDQLFETLVTTRRGGTDPAPALARSWTPSADGLTWSFRLQPGVRFHDGTAFDARAVCFNFDRWYHFEGVQQAESVSYYWRTVFGGFATQADPGSPAGSLYRSCEARSAEEAAINLTRPSSSFLAGLAVPAFSIASPDALVRYEADKVSGSADAPRFEGTFGTRHPVGTGPFRLQSYTPNDRLVMVRNDDYWGERAHLDRLIFRPIPDGPARRQALESGEIQGYDFVDPGDIESLGRRFTVLRRPAFNVGYVGFNQSKPPLDDVRVRRAVAHALDRPALVRAKYPPGSEVAREFMPPQLFGYADDVTAYDHDPERARRLLAEAGVAHPTLELWYPTAVSRPYMPDPAATFQAFKADLEAVGFEVVARSAPWKPEYTQKIAAGEYQMYLYGWTGDFGDPDNFIGTFFQTRQPAWGFDDPKLFALLDEAERETDQARREALYEEANRAIMDLLPGVPYVHTRPALAFARHVRGYTPSPVSLEPFSTVTLG